MGFAMSRICTICARGGSKGVKNKNVRLLQGMPLLAHSIIQAKKASIFDAIAVSSDSEVILETAKQWGVDCLIKRPTELASDTAGKLPAIRHCVLEVEKKYNKKFDIVVDLDATSPLRVSDDICNAVQILERKNISNVLTAMPARRSPYFNLVETNDQGVVFLSKQLPKPVLRRQDSPQCYDMNASIYVWKRETLLLSDTLFNFDTALYVMPEERSVDIDSELDFAFVEFILNHRKPSAD